MTGKEYLTNNKILFIYLELVSFRLHLLTLIM